MHGAKGVRKRSFGVRRLHVCAGLNVHILTLSGTSRSPEYPGRGAPTGRVDDAKRQRVDALTTEEWEAADTSTGDIAQAIRGRTSVAYRAGEI